MRAIAIIPAFNEEEALPAVLSELGRVRPDIDVVVVDDGSRDRTADVARTGGATVLRLPYNLGIGGALRVGFKYATRNGYDRAVQFDADGQHDAGEIAKLFDALDAGADMAIGTRFAEGSGEYVGAGLLRRRAMGLLRLSVRRLTGRRFTDTSSGFRAFDRRVLELFARTYPIEYMDSVEALLLAWLDGADVVEVPTTMHERTGGVPSNRSFKLVYNYLRLLIVIAMYLTRRRPQRRALPEAVA